MSLSHKSGFILSAIKEDSFNEQCQDVDQTVHDEREPTRVTVLHSMHIQDEDI